MLKLTQPTIKATIVACTLALGTLSLNTQAATLQISNGILMGANGVTVNGKSYDVRFGDGIFGNNISSVFNTYDSAFAGMNALDLQVFQDSSQGNFDSAPSLTNGCSVSNVCAIHTIWMATNNSFFRSFTNWDKGNDNFGNGISEFTFDSAVGDNGSWRTIATWYTQGSAPAINTGVSAVPVPAAAWLFGSALAGFVGLSRRKQVA